MKGKIIVTYALIANHFTGRFFFWPSNGPYNLFAGNNPFSISELKQNYNAEYSLDQGIKWCGYETNRFNSPKTVFTFCTGKFIKSKPISFIKVTLFKTFNLLFRPNLRLAISDLKTLYQYLAIFPIVLWWFLFLFCKLFRIIKPSNSGAVFVFVYALPFIFTNSDPRFRMPLDIIYGLSFIHFSLRRS